MAAIARMDEMVKDYLLYRGLNSTLRAFELELKNEKDKGFRVDKIVEQLQAYVSFYDLVAVRDYWNYLDHRIFSRLEQVYANSVRKLEVSLLKYYVVNAVQSGRPDKVNEFFDKLAPDLQHQAEWKEWFVLPFIRTPEESATFAVYFTRQWQETFLVSLHNFLSVIFQSMPVPSLLHFEEDSRRLTRLQQENDLYHEQLGSALDRRDMELLLRRVEEIESSRQAGAAGPTSMDLMDDFFVISQDTTIQEQEQQQQQPKTIRTFMKNIGLPTSPSVGKKSAPVAATSRKSQPPPKEDSSSGQGRVKVKEVTGGKTKVKATGGTAGASSSGTTLTSAATKEDGEKGQKLEGATQVKAKEKVASESVAKVRENPEVQLRSEEMAVTSPERDIPSSFKAASSGSSQQPGVVAVDGPEGGDLLLLSQEEYAEHRSSITHCRFSTTGHTVATSDVDGVVKVWSLEPSPVTLATIMSKSMLLSMEWASHKDRLLLLGNKAGSVRLFDVKEKKTLKEAMVDPTFPRIISLSSSPNGKTFVCSASARGKGGGRLAVWDLQSMKVQHALPLAPGPVAVNCTSHNQNGQLLLTGAADGVMRLFDLRLHECIASWTSHSGEVYSSQFSPDESACYSMATDGKFCKWSLHRTGTQMADLAIHKGACGPFVLTGAGGYRQVQTPKGKLFALDSDGQYVLTCANNGGLVYKFSGDVGLDRVMLLGGHNTPVVSVDWSSANDCRMCLTGAMDGKVQVSTLLSR